MGLLFSLLRYVAPDDSVYGEPLANVQLKASGQQLQKCMAETDPDCVVHLFLGHLGLWGLQLRLRLHHGLIWSSQALARCCLQTLQAGASLVCTSIRLS